MRLRMGLGGYGIKRLGLRDYEAMGLVGCKNSNTWTHVIISSYFVARCFTVLQRGLMLPMITDLAIMAVVCSVSVGFRRVAIETRCCGLAYELSRA